MSQFVTVCSISASLNPFICSLDKMVGGTEVRESGAFFHLFLCVCRGLSVYLFVSVSVCLSVCLSVSLSLSLSLSDFFWGGGGAGGDQGLKI